MSSPLAALFLMASLLAAALLQGCEFFSTKDLASKPSDIRPFAASFTTKDTLRFRVTESLVEPGSGKTAKSDVVLAKRILRFAKAPDSLQEGGGWITVSVAVDSDPAGTYKDRGLIRLRFDASGTTIRSADSSSAGAGSSRYFPLKVAADPGQEGADTTEFLVLPSAFLPGADWVGAMGVLEVSRTIEDVDTLDYGRHLEESWRVSETVRGGGRAVAQGDFWYGASGLLKAEQVWEFEGRASDGSPSAPKELRRDLVRL